MIKQTFQSNQVNNLVFMKTNKNRNVYLQAIQLKKAAKYKWKTSKVSINKSPIAIIQNQNKSEHCGQQFYNNNPQHHKAGDHQMLAQTCPDGCRTVNLNKEM